MGSRTQTIAPDRETIRQGGDWRLALPARLIEVVKIHFPTFRVPAQTDLTDGWAGSGSSGELPFIVWGDFNGDGLTDVAVVLLNDKEWRFIICHKQPDETYELAYSSGGLFGTSENASITRPQDITLLRIRKGTEHEIKSGGQRLSFVFPFDAIDMIVDESASYIVSWKEGSYHELSFVD